MKPKSLKNIEEPCKNVLENKDDQKTSEVREANLGSDNKIISEKEKDNTEPKTSVFSCDNCEYTCKNQKSLKKHGNRKHQENI